MHIIMLYWGYVGIMEKKMETTTIYFLQPTAAPSQYCRMLRFVLLACQAAALYEVQTLLGAYAASAGELSEWP